MTSKPASSNQKRSSRSEPVKTRKARQAKDNSAPPPVMARGYNMDVSYQGNQSYTKKNRRRIDVPLGEPGAEMRLPSLPAVRMSARWLSLLMLVILAVGGYFLWNAPFFQVNLAEIRGLQRVKSGDVNAVLQISGKPVFSINPKKLQKDLLAAFPEFSSVTVGVSLPNSVVVTARERVPVITWRSSGQNQFVDSEGYAFPMRVDASQPISPVVEASGPSPTLGVTMESIAAMVAADAESQSGQQENQAQSTVESEAEKVASNQPFIKPEMVAAILAIAEAMPANGALVYNPDHGLGWQDERGWKVYLGDDQQIQVKLSVYDAIVQRLSEEEIQPALISVEYVHNPYYRLEE